MAPSQTSPCEVEISHQTASLSSHSSHFPEHACPYLASLFDKLARLVSEKAFRAPHTSCHENKILNLQVLEERGDIGEKGIPVGRLFRVGPGPMAGAEAAPVGGNAPEVVCLAQGDQ